MANQYINPSWVAKECLRSLKNNCVMARSVNTQYSSEFKQNGYKVGSTINVRKPPKYTVRRGLAAAMQDTTFTYTPVTINQPIGVDLPFDIMAMATNVSDRELDAAINAAMLTIANDIDAQAFQLYSKIADIVGTPGQISAGTATLQQIQTAVMAASVRLDENLAPMDEERNIVLSPAMAGNMVSPLTTLFNPNQNISRIFTRGALGDGILGFNFAKDQNAISHTTGTATGTPQAFTTAAAVQASGNAVQADASTTFTLNTAALSGTLTAGTSFTIAGVYNVNDKTKVSTGTLKNFVVTANAAGGATALSIFPYPVFSGAFQNCTSASGAIPASTACLTLNGAPSTTYPNAIAFHRDAMALVTVDMQKPVSGMFRQEADPDSGLSLSVWTQSDISSGQTITRIDVMAGWALLYPEWACRITG